jgi:hypothetical protein
VEVMPVIMKILEVQHLLNPLHLYCRFVDRGYNKTLSAFVCKAYEKLVFAWMSPFIKGLIYIYCLKSGSFKIRDRLRQR